MEVHGLHLLWNSELHWLSVLEGCEAQVRCQYSTPALLFLRRVSTSWWDIQFRSFFLARSTKYACLSAGAIEIDWRRTAASRLLCTDTKWWRNLPWRSALPYPEGTLACRSYLLSTSECYYTSSQWETYLHDFAVAIINSLLWFVSWRIVHSSDVEFIFSFGCHVGLQFQLLHDWQFILKVPELLLKQNRLSAIVLFGNPCPCRALCLAK